MGEKSPDSDIRVKRNFKMIDYKGMAVFATVVEAGSLSAAGRRLGISTSAVSQHLRRLEERLGVVLLNRSTRKLGLTDAGQSIAAHCQSIVSAAEAIEQQLSRGREAPSGQLRLSAPQGLSRHIASALSPLLARNPGLSLHLLLDDEFVDLIEERIDVALRVGHLPDSNWVARRLCDIECVFCAAPAYLAQRPPICRPDDLVGQQWLGAARNSAPHELLLTGPQGESRSVLIAPRVHSNSRQSLSQMCCAGLGLAHMARLEVEDELRTGSLVPVLPSWTRPAYPVWAVTPRRDIGSAKVRDAIEAIERHLLTLAGVHVRP